MQEAQRGHGQILGGVDNSRTADVRIMLQSSSSALRDVTATPFDSDFGLRGSITDLLTTSVKNGNGDKEDEQDDKDGKEEKDEDGEKSARKAIATKLKRENILRAQRKFVQDILDVKTKLEDFMLSS